MGFKIGDRPKANDSAGLGSETDVSEISTINEFTTLLYGDAVGWLSLWNSVSKRSHHIQLPDPTVGEQVAAMVRKGQEVYFGCALRRNDPGPSRRGTRHDVSVVPGFWLDIDVRGPAHAATDLVESKEEAQRLLNDIEAPSLYVDSGNGLHAWYLFDKPWEVTEAEIGQVQAQFNAKHAEIQARFPYRLDSVVDLARVLRLPGTLNHKTTPPQTVRLLPL